MLTNCFWLLRQTLLFNSVHLNVCIRYGEWANCIYLLRWCSNSFLRFQSEAVSKSGADPANNNRQLLKDKPRLILHIFL